MDCHPRPHRLPLGLQVAGPHIVAEATRRSGTRVVHARLARRTAQVTVPQVRHGLLHVRPQCIRPKGVGSALPRFSCAEPQFYAQLQVNGQDVSYVVAVRARSLVGRLVPQASSSL